MAKKKRKRSSKIGLPPGSMVHVGEQKVDKIGIDVIDYNADKFESRTLTRIEEAYPYKISPTVSWINLTGLHEIEIIRTFGSHFEIHPLVLEDLLNTEQRPKVEVFDDYLFIVLKMITFDKKKQKINREQISLIMGKNYVITFQEYEGDIFDPLRERIKQSKGRIRIEGVDYLMYALMDIIIDNYFLVLEELGEHIEELEEEVISNPDNSMVEQIHRLKNELMMFRRSVWPLRELISNLVRDEIPLISKSTTPFLRDLYDHSIHISDSVDTFRDMVSGLLEVYLSNVSNRMNEVMKVLTIIATIFIPLSFIAGIYGMNFEFMPELKWRWAYFVLWGIIIFTAGFMLRFFRRKKWL